ncbi:hypothetical protein H072_2618 [Dactylellina haptotyla CBS 200.50]|uniref:Uncharacterized protein n=1 Tax=Dactylellina haptotyla (strain CBS 200.50) TaxID=1284197 RepID=S8C6R0_DACHA|nr:hypothetical protein H072_2618 [Dactylellina haptotyla CBS 200.50]
MKVTGHLLTILTVLSAAASANILAARGPAKSGADVKAVVIERGKRNGVPPERFQFWEKLPASTWDQLYQLEVKAGGKDGRPMNAEFVPALEKAYLDVLEGKEPNFPSSKKPGAPKPAGVAGGSPTSRSCSVSTPVSTPVRSVGNPPGALMASATAAPKRFTTTTVPLSKSVSSNSTSWANPKPRPIPSELSNGSRPSFQNKNSTVPVVPRVKSAATIQARDHILYTHINRLARRSAKLTGARLRATFMGQAEKNHYAPSQIAFYRSIPQSSWDRIADLSCRQVTPTGRIDYRVKSQYNRAMGQIFRNQLPTFN